MCDFYHESTMQPPNWIQKGFRLCWKIFSNLQKLFYTGKKISAGQTRKGPEVPLLREGARIFSLSRKPMWSTLFHNKCDRCNLLMYRPTAFALPSLKHASKSVLQQQIHKHIEHQKISARPWVWVSKTFFYWWSHDLHNPLMVYFAHDHTKCSVKTLHIY